MGKRNRGLGLSSGSDSGSGSGSDRDRDRGSDIKKIRKRESSTYKRRKSEDITHYELKDIRKLVSNDEAFILSWSEIRDIIYIIRSRKTPIPETYMKWDEYQESFYLKMCTCIGVDYQHLETEDELEDGKKQLPSASKRKGVPFDQLPLHMIREIKMPIEFTPEVKSQLLPKKKELLENKLSMEFTDWEKTRPLTKEEHLKNLMRKEWVSVKPIRSGPLETGYYSPGEEPDRIPYHLYLLVKEAVDLIKGNVDLVKDNDLLEIVEEKINFFCKCFHSHLPTGWEYKRGIASSLIADYDAMSRPKYLMTGFTPSVDLDVSKNDVNTNLTEKEMADVMSLIHSRKTPTFRKMGWPKISFYCKLCSCFGIEYHRLEAASEDDLCLLNMGRNG